MKCMRISSLFYELCNKHFPVANKSIDKKFDLQLFAGEKTEDPTAKKQSDAKNKGQVGKSQEINSTFVILSGFLALKVFGGSIYNEIVGYMIYIFSHLDQPVDVESVMHLFLGMLLVLAKTALPIMAVITITGLTINYFQVGIIFSTEAIGFKLEKLNPITGFGRMFSKRSLVELAKSILKILVVGFFIYRYLAKEITQLPKLIYADLNSVLHLTSDLVFTLAFQICGVMFVLAVIDYMYQKWEHLQGLKMSKQDVKDENKQSEGDPQIKGKIKQKQREMAMQRMMQEVPKADVIITNPTHFAVALKYEQGMTAPVIVAKGKDLIAQRIKEIAKEARVVIVENRPLARALYATADIGDVVPQDLYKSVAEVLAYVYRLKNKKLA
ncbi:flagellar biosynthesis protein FlhB [Propionispira raffinosivorans]|uniref:flagellar biosynthesis protein FlhB n=1 Tax=Propionispira raffinosivorans TaxID=86959 RepID=UPI00036B16A4|nr:flagellar biosynthesis protein FlhB [Propionispira raffinosivorans]